MRRAGAAVLVMQTAVLTTPTSVSANDNPATQDLALSCSATPAFTTGDQSGVTAVARGETVTFASSMHLEPGVVYQDILQRADGSTYFASWIEVSPRTGSPLVHDDSSVSFSIAGVPTPTTSGVTPVPGQWVLDTTQNPFRVYFPGDGAAMLANPSGAGVASWNVPVGGQDIELAYTASVPSGSDPGSILPGAQCNGSVSTGPIQRRDRR